MSHDDLTKHKRFPFTEFASDNDDYRYSQLFWDNAFREALGKKADSWVDWMQDPFCDGHPIFSKINNLLSKGIVLQQVNRVLQQVDRKNDKFWFKCWRSEFSDDKNDAIPYLFIETFVSGPSRERFIDLIRTWCLHDVTPDTMRRITNAVRINTSKQFSVIDFQ